MKSGRVIPGFEWYCYRYCSQFAFLGPSFLYPLGKATTIEEGQANYSVVFLGFTHNTSGPGERLGGERGSR